MRELDSLIDAELKKRKISAKYASLVAEIVKEELGVMQ